MDKVDQLYQNYDILADPKNKASEHGSEYLEIIESVKGSPNEKMLACQFIPRFLKDFPNLAETALDAQLDLIDDEEVSVRKHAVKHLPTFCKENKDFVAKIADVLTQMLQSDDSGELATVHTALMTIFKIDVKATLEGMFIQIETTDEDAIRKRAIQFLCAKFKFLPPELIAKDVEEFILEKCKIVFPSISGEDFLNLMPLLSNLKIAKTIPVQQTLVGLIAEQAELTSEFQVTEENIAGFLQCVRLAMPYFSAYVTSKAFITYICMSMIPKFDEIGQLENGSDLNLEIIKILAEISDYTIEDEQLKECTNVIYKYLLNYLPLPPPTDSENLNDEPNMQFTHIESLLFTFIHLLRPHSDFLTSEENSPRFKDLKSRLQYLARGIQNGIKTFRESLVGTKDKEAKPEDTKMKALALRTMNNINSLIKDMFRIPPTFKTSITLSWKPVASRNSISAPKREAESPTPVERKHVKRDTKSGRELYAPPSGKYSTNVNSFSPRRGGSFYRGNRGRRFY